MRDEGDPAGDDARTLVACRHCGHDDFVARRVVWDVVSHARVLVCTACGHMHWFAEPVPASAEAVPEEPSPPEPVPDPASGDPQACLACGAAMQVGEARCPECGLRYVEPEPAPAAKPPPLPVRRPSGPSGVEAGPVEEPEPEPIGEPEPPPAQETCARCGALRPGGTLICKACGSLFTGD